MAAYCWYIFAECHNIHYTFSGTFVALIRRNQVVAWNMESGFKRCGLQTDNPQNDFATNRDVD